MRSFLVLSTVRWTVCPVCVCVPHVASRVTIIIIIIIIYV